MGIISGMYNEEIFIAQERPDSREYADLTKMCMELEETFLSTLTDGQKELYDRLNDVRNECTQKEMEHRFVTGFKMGAKLEREILG